MYSIALKSLEVIIIVIESILLHLNINSNNQQTCCGTGKMAGLLSGAIRAAYYPSMCFEYGFFIAKKL